MVKFELLNNRKHNILNIMHQCKLDWLENDPDCFFVLEYDENPLRNPGNSPSDENNGLCERLIKFSAERDCYCFFGKNDECIELPHDCDEYVCSGSFVYFSTLSQQVIAAYFNENGILCTFTLPDVMYIKNVCKVVNMKNKDIIVTHLNKFFVICEGEVYELELPNGLTLNKLTFTSCFEMNGYFYCSIKGKNTITLTNKSVLYDVSGVETDSFVFEDGRLYAVIDGWRYSFNINDCEKFQFGIPCKAKYDFINNLLVQRNCGYNLVINPTSEEIHVFFNCEDRPKRLYSAKNTLETHFLSYETCSRRCTIHDSTMKEVNHMATVCELDYQIQPDFNGKWYVWPGNPSTFLGDNVIRKCWPTRIYDQEVFMVEGTVWGLYPSSIFCGVRTDVSPIEFGCGMSQPFLSPNPFNQNVIGVNGVLYKGNYYVGVLLRINDALHFIDLCLTVEGKHNLLFIDEWMFLYNGCVYLIIVGDNTNIQHEIVQLAECPCIPQRVTEESNVVWVCPSKRCVYQIFDECDDFVVKRRQYWFSEEGLFLRSGYNLLKITEILDVDAVTSTDNLGIFEYE
ncbi:hypothetical protein PCE1_001820 [Barthelona sp. PCE]